MIQDMSADYNTSLTPEEEKSYLEWATKNKRLQDAFDYDMRGWWKENGGAAPNGGHFTDKFKKPNHPTFSNESIYHGREGNLGGMWDEKGFTAGPTNLRYYTPLMLQDYFNRVEPTMQLRLPEG